MVAAPAPSTPVRAPCAALDYTYRAQPFLNHGLCLMALKKYGEAEPLIRRATELDKDNSYALLTYGVLAMDYLGDPQAALNAFQGYKRLGGEDKRVDAWIKKLGG